jgi:hypothetical protein
LTSHSPRRPSPVIFAAILASAAILSLLITISPYLFTHHDPGAISIGASLNPTTVSPNQTIKVTVSDKNGLQYSADELSLPADWALAPNLTMGPQCGPPLPFGVAVFEGSYDLGTVLSGKELIVNDPFAINGCGSFPLGDSFTFKPGQNVSASTQLDGYYTGERTDDSVHPFTPGEYTVLVGDAWGHMEVLHFEVTSASTANTTTLTKGTYAVTFQQIGACSPEFWGVPWSVTIGSVTEVQPPDTRLPLDNYSLSGTSNSSMSEITFSLANGTYDYTVSPSAEFFTPTFGTINVSGSSVTVDIAYTGTSCITTYQTASTGNKTA